MEMQVFAVVIALSTIASQCQGTVVGFYSATCPQAESTIKAVVGRHFIENPAIAPGILRMHFHDCFVRGCDGSVLVEGKDTERMATPNLGLHGFEVIEDAKSQLEVKCPGIVSCADILALAARDSIVLTKGLSWDVPTGRRDGRISLAADVKDLPAPTESIDAQKDKFAAMGLDMKDFVTLLGGHTIGKTACQFFQYRLYEFPGGLNGTDATIDPAFVPRLKALCPQKLNGTGRVELDSGSAAVFDTSFFTNLKLGRGVLESDQRLWGDASTKQIVEGMINGTLNFGEEFGRAMIKMSNIGVLTGTAGEVRKVCSKIN